ncbi:fructose-bisphosphate aldolase-lysine N-methyltransferase, chloroplastic [Selaginella moellendorffii]|uniref:fructose-bisphosphate aldolase-lysine N-methyltransferase, chloroplastic n=1 Tax=Selaginella moellendorffii TaxID=88036 RepID=UPI000D1CB52A|nr:fructose-bisphosphate aldolase-lysine N-methyltransferase, chloroplastic [Selaginella moellendorffii]|eukprot:XP_024535646.1 fructose-bisphosphate aldolase-lysine N-methyltransferase, chloroplastic [Selaginella moellendorffii]
MSIGAKSDTATSTKSEDLRKSSKNGAKKIKRKIIMWATCRRRILCLPAPDAVCGGRSGHRIVCVPHLSGGRGANSSSSSETKEQCEFSSWLKRRGEHDPNTGLSIGLSPHGRGLFASRPIHTGECMLHVSHDLMITPEKLPEEVTKLLSKDVSAWAKLALFLLAHQKKKETSAWAPYISCLPPFGSMHSTIFWTQDELVYLKVSPVYRETVQRKDVVRMEFAAAENALLLCPHIFGSRVSALEFKHAYATVCSRAWGIETIKSLALVPFVDFFNHDANCRAMLSYDEDRHCAEVVSDRDYATGDQVVISYGQLSNATLALDFGFALPFNPHDQAGIWLSLSEKDPLRDSKLKLLHSHNMQTCVTREGVDTAGSSFSLQEVKSKAGRGKGIPQTLRAFARVVCATTSEELDEMAKFAADTDGRLARRPSIDKTKEHKAMTLLQTVIDNRIQKHEQAASAIRDSAVLQKPRKEIAKAIVGGELRVLRSASAWLKQHSQALLQT